MRVVAISDLHGQLPDTPDGDLLIVAGDICPVTNHGSVFQADFINTTFRTWLERQPARKKVFVGGNHDFVLQQRPWWHKKYPARYLQDSGCSIDGINVWGSPWSNQFGKWAFMGNEVVLAEHWANIPQNTDILVVHGPPHGAGDRVPRGRVGSITLATTIKTIRPKVVVCGHIHDDYGLHLLDGVPVINASYLNDNYRAAHDPIVFNIEPGRGIECRPQQTSSATAAS